MTALRTLGKRFSITSGWSVAYAVYLLPWFWAITDTDEVVEVEKKPETEVELQIQPEKWPQ